MRISLRKSLASHPVRAEAFSVSVEKYLVPALLVAVAALAGLLRFARLSALGFANHYYTAAVASMLTSWHNFFFVAAEPGGLVSVDKPPLGLWLQASSAYFLGVNGFAVLLPQLLAGMASVIVLYYLVRRWFDAAAGLLAALVLAITPIVVATDRNNTMDSTLILVLLLAAWAFIKSVEGGGLRWLLLGAFLVGLGFNIKMLQAYLPLPALFGLYLLGGQERLWSKVGNLALAGLLLVVVSFSWSVVVDLTPADQRPYVGSSGNNSEMNLIIGYNGINRLLGMFGRGGPGGPPQGGPPRWDTNERRAFNRVTGGDDTQNQPGMPDAGGPGMPPVPPGTGSGWNGGTNPGGPPPMDGYGMGEARNFPPGPGPGPGSRVGPGMMGQMGPLRLFLPPLNKEVSWLLPFGLASVLLLMFSARLSWPLKQPHQALVLWGGWLITGGIFFSVANFFHEYYLSMLAPPLAALVAIGAVLLWRLRERRPWLGILVLLAVAGGTLAFQWYTAQSFIGGVPWLALALAVFGLGALLLIYSILRTAEGLARVGYTCVLAALLLTPAIWSGLTTYNSSANQSLPSAYDGRDSGPANRGGLQINQKLLNYLQENTQDVKYLMAVPSSMQGADYVIATNRPVLYMGGFNGQDPVVASDDLELMVSQKELRFIYFDARGGGGSGPGSQAGVSSWVSANCTAVPGFSTATRNMGAPDGTQIRQDPVPDRYQPGFQGPGGMQQITLYDCAQ